MERPDPDRLLESIEQEEEKKKRGRLKIFFGYAAGVGKTCSMLKEAGRKKAEGCDVVIGYLEPHARPETMALAKGLETVPVRSLEYRGITLHEMDVDGVLKRKPQLVLVDEFAHTNAQGSRHRKRYQDVEELLKAGIDVYTTVNVQHIESLCDIVAGITGIVVRERIPDRVFDMADEVKLIDIEPDVLIQRLKEGRIYSGEQAGRAMENFFTPDRLTALREIALRRTADRVNQFNEKSGRKYVTEEKILVGISPSPSNPKIIRAAARMAKAFGGTMIGLYVETPAAKHMNIQDLRRLHENMHLAEQLGARIETSAGEDVPFLIAEYARNAGISRIVAGRSMPSRTMFHRPSFVDRLTMYAPDMDIYIIPDMHMEQMKKQLAVNMPGEIRTSDCMKAGLILVVTTLVGFLFDQMGFSDTNIITIYILAVMISAVITQSRLLSFVQSLLSILVFNFCFTSPRYSLNIYDSGYIVTFLITFMAALITGNLALKMKLQAKELARSAYRTRVILEINQVLEKCGSVKEILNTTAQQLNRLLNRPVVCYGKGEKGLMGPVIHDQNRIVDETERIRLEGENERAVAQWVMKNNRHAGASTGTLDSAACYYLAVRSHDEVYGVIGIRLDPNETLSAFDSNVLMAVLSESAGVMEREILRKKEADAREMAYNQQLRANLLRSISHDLRTPLTGICGNADILLDSQLSEEKRKQICTYIHDDAMWLIRLVENLLSVTRIEDGTMHIHKQAELLADIIDEALRHVDRRAANLHFEVIMEDELVLVKVDSGLIMQVIINIVDNAVRYSPQGSTITITTEKHGPFVHVLIADEGIGIPDVQKPFLFEMFYTVNRKIADCHRSLGLGLALCRSVITAHGGEIRVKDNHPKGTVFEFTLPIDEVKIHE
ncbi:MAG: DUF4118 domain-containing protein [Bulleidia sp.]